MRKQIVLIFLLTIHIVFSQKNDSNLVHIEKTATITSWNIQDLGRTKNTEEILAIAKIIKNSDVVLIQEVVGKDPAGIQAVGKIINELNRMGFKWDYKVSNPTNSPSAHMSERYAFLWKTAKVALHTKPYLDKDLEQLCYREPYVGAFIFKNISQTPVYIINYHSRKHSDYPEQEIKHLKNYQAKLKGDNPIIIGGDFNVTEKHTVWNPFYKKGFSAALHDTKTTLKRKCNNGNYLNHSIDNFYYTNSLKLIQSNAIDFVKNCKNIASSRLLSDHLPISMTFRLAN